MCSYLGLGSLCLNHSDLISLHLTVLGLIQNESARTCLADQVSEFTALLRVPKICLFCPSVRGCDWVLQAQVCRPPGRCVRDLGVAAWKLIAARSQGTVSHVSCFACSGWCIMNITIWDEIIWWPLCEIKEYKVYKALWAQRALLGVAFRDKKVSLQVPVVGGDPESHTNPM